MSFNSTTFIQHIWDTEPKEYLLRKWWKQDHLGCHLQQESLIDAQTMKLKSAILQFFQGQYMAHFQLDKNTNILNTKKNHYF